MTDDIDLIERIESALKDLSGCPWLPDLTDDLVRIGWRALYQEAGLSPSTYGTSRVMAKSVFSPRNVVARLSGSTAVEVLDKNFAASYADTGIAFYTAREIVDANLLSYVAEAVNLISRVSTLQATVAALVRSLHLIKPENDNYDVSFSEPHIPFSIFVSIPQQRTSTTILRVAEAVVHEAMHLQLTLVESVLTLVGSTDGRYFSPWRREHRDAKGLLHALYVFRVIDQFLAEMSSPEYYETDDYRSLRRTEIAEEMNQARSFKHCTELTPVGCSLVQRLMLPRY